MLLKGALSYFQNVARATRINCVIGVKRTRGLDRCSLVNMLRLLRLYSNRCNKIPNVNRHVPIHLSSTKFQEFSSSIDNEPVKYSQSPAYQYKAKTTRTGVSVPRLWYEPYVIMASISVFLLYFTVIREENDIDEELSRSLYSRISGLEEHQLRLSLEYNQEHGLETEAITNRLKEIEIASN